MDELLHIPEDGLEPEEPQEPQDGPGPIHGVFSIKERMTIGHGATKKKVEKEVYYFAEDDGRGQVALRLLNAAFAPSGEARTIGRDELLEKYVPEPEVYMRRTKPAMKQVEETVDKADRHRKKGELFTAEFEYKQALRVDEEHVRATFGLGLTYLDRNDKAKAVVVFKKLVKMDAAYERKHKHLFNEFGIKLRRNTLYDEALAYYSKAHNLSRDDENLLYNMARAFHAKGDASKARQYLGKAIEIRRNFPEAQAMLDILDQGGGKSKALSEEEKAQARKKREDALLVKGTSMLDGSILDDLDDDRADPDPKPGGKKKRAIKIDLKFL